METEQKESADMIAELDSQSDPTQSTEDFITKQELARRLGRGLRTIDSWKHNGLIPYYKVGKCVYFRYREVQRAIARMCRREN